MGLNILKKKKSKNLILLNSNTHFSGNLTGVSTATDMHKGAEDVEVDSYLRGH